MTEKIWKFLSSTRLAIILLIVLTVVSVAGIALPRIFSSAGFYGLLGMLSLNTVACIITRLWGHLSHSRPFPWNLKETGSLLFHFSILLLFLGGLLGKFGGYSVLQELADGETAPVPDRPFLVRSDWFRIELNEKGQVREYKTKLSLLRPDSSCILEKVIKVNDPLSYDGVRFYQASYGRESEEIADASLRITGTHGDSFVYEGVFPFQRTTALPGTRMTLLVQRFLGDFVLDTGSKTPYSRSEEHNNPAVQVVLTDTRSQQTTDQWAFLNYPRVHMAAGKYRVALLQYTPKYFTGIQIKRSPGTILIWIGLALMTLGILAMFCIPRQTVNKGGI